MDFIDDATNVVTLLSGVQFLSWNLNLNTSYEVETWA